MIPYLSKNLGGDLNSLDLLVYCKIKLLTFFTNKNKKSLDLHYLKQGSWVFVQYLFSWSSSFKPDKSFVV